MWIIRRKLKVMVPRIVEIEQKANSKEDAQELSEWFASFGQEVSEPIEVPDDHKLSLGNEDSKKIS